MLIVPSYSQSLMNVATACCLSRKRKKCKNKWSEDCKCDLNVAQYIEGRYTTPQLKLFMLQAEQQAAIMDIPRENKWWLLKVVVIITLLFIGGCTGLKACADYGNREWPKPNDTPPVTAQQVRQIIREVRRSTVDLDGDGLNCRDAAWAFYQRYPNKNDIMIVQNYNPPTMNHLFIRARVDGRWVEIEPRARGNDFSMRTTWGRRYNGRWRDETEFYIWYFTVWVYDKSAFFVRR